MLGYIRAHGPELRMRDYDRYRSLYCGLCRHMGKCTGQCSRLSLSYDFVFLAALRIALLEEKLQTKPRRCLLHPFQKRNTVVDCETLKYCAHASALLTYHKCKDDLSDEHGFKKIRARAALIFFHGGYKKAKKRYPELDATIARSLSRLAAYEKDDTAPPSADAPALLFADLMAAVFSEGLEGTNARIASAVGKAIGHWIYLSDAADDFLKDQKEKSFNPYLRLFGDFPTEEDWNAVRLGQKKLLTDAERAFLLIDTFPEEEIREILCNILYLGLPNTTERILNQTSKGDQDKNEKSL